MRKAHHKRGKLRKKTPRQDLIEKRKEEQLTVDCNGCSSGDGVRGERKRDREE